ncbi:MAG: 8-oxo-dGTP diphosphatase MutT [Psychrobium sp.]|nr:8-oxo-dGTP diphosphatase MutT [Psychrobium sp.]
MKKIAVAVGVIENSHGEILLAKRHQHLHQGGKWEFPGGKIEQGETTLVALRRELLEEVAIDVVEAAPVMILDYDYGDRLVSLDIWHVTNFIGQAKGLEQQEIKWVAKSQLSQYQFPDANQPIVDWVLGVNS